MAIDPGVQEHLNEHYDKDMYPILFEDGKISSPVFACCEVKQEREGVGRKYIQKITTYEGAAVAEDPAVSDAIAGDGAAGGRPTRDRWEITPTAMDATFVFSRDEIDAMEGSPDDQFDAITQEMDMALMRLRNQLCQRVTQKGWGLLAQTTAQSATGFTVDPAYVNLFPVGKRLQASITEDTDVLANSAAILRVTAADPVTGVITTSANPVTSWANDADLFIFSAGSRIATDPAAASDAKLGVSGLPAWIDPVGQATIFSITRTGDPRVVGFDINCANMDTATGFLTGADTLFNFGVQETDTIFCSGTSWKLLQQDYDPTKVVAVTVGDYKIGYEGYKLATVFGNVTIIPDPFIAPGTAYAGPFMDKKWRPKMLHSNKKLINLDDHDGKQFERVTTSGARTYKGQFYFRGQLCIAGPGKYAKLRNLPTS